MPVRRLHTAVGDSRSEGTDCDTQGGAGTWAAYQQDGGPLSPGTLAQTMGASQRRHEMDALAEREGAGSHQVDDAALDQMVQALGLMPRV